MELSYKQLKLQEEVAEIARAAREGKRHEPPPSSFLSKRLQARSTYQLQTSLKCWTKKGQLCASFGAVRVDRSLNAGGGHTTKPYGGRGNSHHPGTRGGNHPKVRAGPPRHVFCWCANLSRLSSLRSGKRLVRLIKAYKRVNEQSKDLVLRVEGVWLKTEAQIDVLLDLLSTKSNYEQRLLRFQEECLDRLETKLHSVLSKLQKYTGIDLADGVEATDFAADATTFTKLKYAFFEKHLHTLIEELEAWHSVFDPSWYLPLTRMPNHEIDTALEITDRGIDKQQKPAFKTIQEIRALIEASRSENPESRFKLPFLPAQSVSDSYEISEGSSLSTAVVVEGRHSVLLDTTEYPSDADPSSVLTTIRKVVRVLSISDPAPLGFLKCRGVIRLNERRFQYVLAVSSRQAPQTLRTLLGSESPSLDARFRIARSLAKTVMSLHSADFVHKNIRPETVVVWPDDIGEMSQPYLVGFGQLRPHSEHSSLVADMVWHRNLYRHPSRQGLRPQEYYRMQHDIYSLGVCLLEVGLWTSFVVYSDAGADPATSLDIAAELEIGYRNQQVLQIKQKLIDKARAQLPSRMGRTYTDVVLSCLTCLDKGAANMFEDEGELYDENGILIGVAFIEKILVRLEDITL